MNRSLLIWVCVIVVLSVDSAFIPHRGGHRQINELTGMPPEFLFFSKVFKDDFHNYKLKFNKVYKSAEEETIRFVYFISAMLEIDDHNKLMSKGEKQYEMGLNHLSDWSDEEFHKLNGLVISNRTGSFYLSPAVKVNIPESIDWREKGAVTEVKKQRHCGSCWSFSATGALEGQLWRKTGKLISLSEQQLVDCDSNDHGCDGGSPTGAFDYIKEAGGIEIEDNYPYVSRSMEEPPRKCKFQKDLVVASDTGSIMLPEGDEEKLKEAVATIGPISIGISAPHSLARYTHGIFHDDNCDSTRINHAVLLVGYGTDESTSKPYWLIKNSWGPHWGENGYFRLERNINSCNIGVYSTYPLM